MALECFLVTEGLLIYSLGAPYNVVFFMLLIGLVIGALAVCICYSVVQNHKMTTNDYQSSLNNVFAIEKRNYKKKRSVKNCIVL